MLEMKELRGRPDGGVGKAVNLFNVKQVDKKIVKTRAFQEACIYSVVDELAKHLAQWSYSVAFFGMSFLPLVQVRNFRKTIKADRFRKEMKDLIHQVEANVEFVSSKRAGITFSSNDAAVDSFLQVEKIEQSSPLSRYVATLHKRAQKRIDAMDETSVIVGAESSTFKRRLSEVQKQQDDSGETIAFSKNLLAEKKKTKTAKEESKKRARDHDDLPTDEDVVEDLVLSSDEEEEDENDDMESDEDGSAPVEDDSDEDFVDPDSAWKKQKEKLKKRNKYQPSNKATSKTKRKPHPKKKAKH